MQLPYVCLSIRVAAAARLLLWAQRAGGIDRLLHGRGSASANAGSATLSADVGS